jgi:nicotinate phosphoribosyltransferase
VRYGTRNVLKLSAGKTTWTGTKQVYRLSNTKGEFEGDLIALDGEPPPSPTAIPLLRTVMRNGVLVGPPPPLEAIRAHCAAEVASLPDARRRLHDDGRYTVTYSPRLVELQHHVEAEVEASEVAGSRTVTQA